MHFFFSTRGKVKFDFRMDKIEDGWFLEKNKQWPGQVFGLEVEEVLYAAKSKYQDILIFKRFLLKF